MKKLDLKGEMSKLELEYKAQVSNLLTLKNEIKVLQERKKQIEGHLIHLKGKFEGLDLVYKSTTKDTKETIVELKEE